MYRIRNEAGGKCEIYLYSLITGGITASDMIRQVRTSVPAPSEITVHINSDGGDIFEVLAVYNYLKGCGIPVSVYVDGIAASAASIVACAGRVTMGEGAMMMIHSPCGFIEGTAEDMAGMAEVLEKAALSAAGIYAAKTGKSIEEMLGLMKRETWLSAREALDLGLCDEIAVSGAGMSLPGAGVSEYEAVLMERKRLQELDGLMTPERREIIMRAKYKTFETAKDIAVELLKASSPVQGFGGVKAYGGGGSDDVSEMVSRIINRKRGYKNG